MKKCTSCQADILDGASFCGACGAKQVASSAIKFCQKCGMEMKSDALFCGTCGQPQDTSVGSTTKKPIPMLIWYTLATVVITIVMAIWLVDILSDEAVPSPVVTKQPIVSIKDVNTTATKVASSEANKTIKQAMSSEIVITKSSLLTRGNIKTFMQNYLQSNCFGGVNEVDMFFSANMGQYFSFANPTHKSIYNENVSYCQKWTTMDYQLDSFEIKNNNSSGNEIDIVANISYHVTNDSKDIYSKAVMPITLVDEFGAIKIKRISSKNQTTAKAKAKNENKNYINPKKDRLARYAYEMITGERLLNSENIRITKNSSNAKIYCVEGICKTEEEVLDYINY